MDHLANELKQESIKSFQSTINKTENALSRMTQKGANTTLIKKRLNALHIGLAVLEYVWNQKPYSYTEEDVAIAREVLIGLLSSIKKVYAKSKKGSPQKTLLERRINSLELAIKAINSLLEND